MRKIRPAFSATGTSSCRTAWLYSYYGKNFVKTHRERRQKIRQAGGGQRPAGQTPPMRWTWPTSCCSCGVTHEYGLYHCTGEGICSWYDFACEIIRLAGVDATVSPLHQRRVQGKTSRQRRPPPLERPWTTVPCAARWATGWCVPGRRPWPASLPIGTAKTA